jgi:hypothetical protein
MKMINSTAITPTRGVTLISLIGWLVRRLAWRVVNGPPG